MKNIDDTDLKILELLKQNSRMSFQEIAQEIEMTDVTVRRRVKDLVDKEVIKKFTIEVDSQKLGKGLCALIRLEMKVSEQKRIMNEIMKFNDEVEQAYYLAGKCGLWIKIDLDDMENLEEFLNDKLGPIDGITNIESCIVLKTLK
ncbi:MAG: Lrp/AsnC family transcriptional regulator [Candidatus Hodarchaeota archaeon]